MQNLVLLQAHLAHTAFLQIDAILDYSSCPQIAAAQIGSSEQNKRHPRIVAMASIESSM